ncbi:toxin glutamine deamidase domain-containing protein [Rhizohabitans arisaemae]|uniref:toxin glutamine deamidase domain-containing protein n=1 Tax=Rhizohabitans arisaemae TaxID=2720610 RepID=UPI0024B0C0E7|nr:toxin glutamine deamidase domain-containing protein [Rhizohabitans arisaemae]
MADRTSWQGYGPVDGARPSRPRSRERVYNPVVGPDGRRWLDYELAAETLAVTAEREPGLPPDDAVDREPELDWFDRASRPPPLADVRPYDVPGGVARPDPQLQADLEEVLPHAAARFVDPRTGWGSLLNGPGPPGEDPFRATNAVECALSGLSTWHGEPVVAAPRRPEYDRIGRPVLSGEPGGVSRAERWLGHRFEYAGNGAEAYHRIGRRLAEGGPGSGAMLINRWAVGGCHTWNAFNAGGQVVWADLQRGDCAERPLYPGVTGIFCVAIDRGGTRL